MSIARRELFVTAGGAFKVGARAWAEELAVQRFEAKGFGVPAAAKDAERLHESEPQVVVPITSEEVLAAITERGHRVVASVGGGAIVRAAVLGEDKPSLLSNHQEQQPVDQPQELPVVAGDIESTCLQRLAQCP